MHRPDVVAITCIFLLLIADGGDWSVEKSPADIYEPMIPLDESLAKREVVRTIHANHENVVKFMCRAVGERSGPSVSAPLADPDLQPNMKLVVVMDSILR